MIRRGLLSILMLTVGLIPLAWAEKPPTSSKLERPSGTDESEKPYLRIYGQDGTFERLVAATDRLQALKARLWSIKHTLLSDDLHEEQLKSLIVRCDDLQAKLDRSERDVAVVLFLLDQARIDGKTSSLIGYEKWANTQHTWMVIDPLKSVFKSSDENLANFARSREGINDLRKALGGDQKMTVRTAHGIKAINEADARLTGLCGRLGDVAYQMRMRVEGHEDTTFTERLTEIVKEMERQRSIFMVLKYWAKGHPESIFGDRP